MRHTKLAQNLAEEVPFAIKEKQFAFTRHPLTIARQQRKLTELQNLLLGGISLTFFTRGRKTAHLQ